MRGILPYLLFFIQRIGSLVVDKCTLKLRKDSRHGARACYFFTKSSMRSSRYFPQPCFIPFGGILVLPYGFRHLCGALRQRACALPRFGRAAHARPYPLYTSLRGRRFVQRRLCTRLFCKAIMRIRQQYPKCKKGMRIYGAAVSFAGTAGTVPGLPAG